MVLLLKQVHLQNDVGAGVDFVLARWWIWKEVDALTGCQSYGEEGEEEEEILPARSCHCYRITGMTYGTERLQLGLSSALVSA